MNAYVELSGNMHMHTPYSDGEKWHAQIAEDAIAAALDFIIVTDHNVWVDGVEGYYENEDGRVLLLSGEEVHNVRRRPQASHFLVYGAEREMVQYAGDPQKLIDATNQAGGHGFLAHPFEKDFRLSDQPNLGWHDWEIDGFTGLEIWNYMSSFVCRLADRLESLPLQNRFLDRLVAAVMALRPQKVLTMPEPEVLALWDQLLAQGKRVTAVGNSDAHGTPMQFGPLKRIIYPYRFLFRAINTHVLLPHPLSGDLQSDKRALLEAISKGNSWIAYDMACPTHGFSFSGQGVNKGIMGDEISMEGGATLQVSCPARAQIRLIHCGTVVAEAANETHLTHILHRPGAYRVECTIPFEGQQRGWIYSNPIYVV